MPDKLYFSISVNMASTLELFVNDSRPTRTISEIKLATFCCLESNAGSLNVSTNFKMKLLSIKY